MNYKNVFKEKKKLVSILVLAIIGTYYWPVLLGMGFSYVVMKYIPIGKMKYIVIAVIIFFSLPAQTGWFLGMTGRAENNKAVTQTAVTEITPTDTAPASMDAPTSPSSPTATSYPTATPFPVNKAVIYPTLTKAPAEIIIPTDTPIPAHPQQFMQTAPAQNSGNSYGGGDMNCSDFSSHAEAQAYFEANGGSPANNVDGLDRDHDGSACESLN